MQKSVAKLLIVFMLLPSLVCGMPICVADADHEQSVTENSHCREIINKNTVIPDVDAFDSTMLLAECTGIDLQTASNPIQFQPSVFVLDVSFYTDIDFWYGIGDKIFLSKTIRGSPFQQFIVSIPSPIYLTTQRLRI